MATESKGAESGGVPGVLTAELRREAWDLADSITETVDMLSAARDRLKNSVSHLQSSNAQLREALEACPDDADFLQAVEENTLIIAKKLATIERVEENLRRLKGSHGQDEADEAGKAGTTAAEDSESGPAAAEEASAAVVAPKQTRETNPTNPAVEADGGVFL